MGHSATIHCAMFMNRYVLSVAKRKPSMHILNLRSENGLQYYQRKNGVSGIGGDIMSLNKSIEHGKEHRKKYRRSKAIDPTCRNHGSCKWCEENRRHKFRDKTYTEQEIAEDIGETKDYTQLSYELLQKWVEKDKEAWRVFINNYKKNYIEEMKCQIADLEAQREALIIREVLDEHMPMPVYKVAHACVCEMDVNSDGN